MDLSPIDLFGMLSPEYLRACTLPAPIVDLGVPSTIHYISMPETGPFVELTAKAFLKVSKTTKDKEVQPGMLDILLIPGPNPSTIFPPAVLDFVRGHSRWQGSDGKSTDVLSICTGCIVLGQSGVLKGKNASGPRGLMPKLQKDFPDTRWVDDRRWVKDGNIWTSGEPAPSLAMDMSTQVVSSDLMATLCWMELIYVRWNHKWSRNGSRVYTRQLSWPCIGGSACNGRCRRKGRRVY